MILNSQSDPLNLSAKLTIEGKDYTIFISSESMKCFICGELGHVRQTCPNRDKNSVNEVLPENMVVGGARGSDVADAAPLLLPQAVTETAPMPAPNDSLEENGESFLLTNSNNSAVEIAQVAQVADVKVFVTQPELSSDHEDESIENEQQIQPEVSEVKTSTDESIDQSQGDYVSQEVDFEKDDDELYDGNDMMDMENISGRTKLYSLQQINTFLDNTKGLRKPSIESHFPDLKLFLISCTVAMRKATFDELDRPKRYRLKKILCTVRGILNLSGKK